MSTRKALIFLSYAGLLVSLVSCRSSFKTSGEVPADVATSAAIQGTTSTVHVPAASSPDTRYKVTVFGQVPPSITCPVISEKFIVKLVGGEKAGEKVVSMMRELDDKSSFEMVNELVPGKYQVILANQKSGKIVDSQTIEVPLRKRYQIRFTACGAM